MIRLEVKNLQYRINREAAKISALLSGKIDKYEYLTGEEVLSSDQNRMMEQPKFSCSSLGNKFEKQKQLKIKEENK